MIINNPQSQKLSLYYIGANVIKIILNHQFKAISPILLFNSYIKLEELSFSYFMYGLDWLFISGVIELTESGDIKLCN